MSHSHQPSGLRGRIEFLIDPGWSPEQAFAVVELLDDLRSRIWAHYAIALSEEYRNQSTRRKTVSIAANLLRHLAPPDSYGNSSPATTGKQREFTVFEPKMRMIQEPPFEDRVIHHALVRLVDPLFERKFIPDSFACRVDKGTQRARVAGRAPGAKIAGAPFPTWSASICAPQKSTSALFLATGRAI